MSAAPFRVLIYPYRFNSQGKVEYALLQAAGDARWQELGGAGGTGETPLQAARRLAFAAGRVSSEMPFTLLDTVTAFQVSELEAKHGWGNEHFVIPQYYFGVHAQAGELALSPAYQASRWLEYSAASRLLESESSRTALWELDKRMQDGTDIPPLPQGATEPLPEPILVLGSETGVITLFGQRFGPASWRYYLSMDGNTLAEQAFPAPRRRAKHPAERVTTWSAAIGLLQDLHWVCMYPLQVHPDFRMGVWEAVVEQGKGSDPNLVAQWMECLERWYKRCYAD